MTNINVDSVNNRIQAIMRDIFMGQKINTLTQSQLVAFDKAVKVLRRTTKYIFYPRNTPKAFGLPRARLNISLLSKLIWPWQDRLWEVVEGRGWDWSSWKMMRPNLLLQLKQVQKHCQDQILQGKNINEKVSPENESGYNFQRFIKKHAYMRRL